MRNILLVEDDKKIQFANKIIFEQIGGYNVLLDETLAEAHKIVAESPLDVIVLDIMLPDGSGLDFLRELRRSKNIPVLLLTALGTSKDVVDGLAAGGDDYLAKPYDTNVLLSRIDAIMRRAYAVPEQLGIGRITIDMASKRAFVDGKDLGLNIKEYSLLEQFVQYPEKVMSAEYLYEKVWGQKMFGDENALKNRLSILRKRLDETSAGYTITTVRHKGYYLEKS